MTLGSNSESQASMLFDALPDQLKNHYYNSADFHYLLRPYLYDGATLESCLLRLAYSLKEHNDILTKALVKLKQESVQPIIIQEER